MTDLASILVTIQPDQDTWPTAARAPFLGRAAHALLLDRVAAVDPALAAELHAGDGPRPFTTAVIVLPTPPNGPPVIRLRWSALNRRLAELLTGPIAAGLPDEVHLAEIGGRITSVTRTGEEVGTTSYQAIVERWLLGGTPAPRRLRFSFLTPTTFRTDGRNLPFPLPGLVFGSLIDRWNLFSPLTLNAEARRFAEECLALARYRLETRIVDLAGGRQTGFVGWAELVALQHDPYWLRVLSALADYAFYAGVGAKTTMGLGQTRRLAVDQPGQPDGGRSALSAERAASRPST